MMEHLSTIICFLEKIVWNVMVSERGCSKSMVNDGKTNPNKHWRVCLEKRSSACIIYFTDQSCTRVMCCVKKTRKQKIDK